MTINKPDLSEFAAQDATFSALPDHRVIELRGRDAIAFVQAQSMNDLRTLDDGHWQWNGWLTPKGRVIALFALLRLDSETLWLLSTDADAAQIAERLRRFVFRSKVTIAVRDDLRIGGAFVRPLHASAARVARDDSGGVELDLGGDGGARALRIVDAAAAIDGDRDGGDADIALFGSSNGIDIGTRWSAFDVIHGLPRLAAAQTEQWTPQQLSLDRLRAYSVAKGCYPGQEIVARTHFLGQAKRGLVGLQADAAVAVGADVVEDGRAIGTVVSTAVVADSGRCAVLAVLPIGAGQHVSLHTGDLPLSPLPLLDGLAR